MFYGVLAALIALTFGTGLSNYVSAALYRITGTSSTAYVDGTGEAVAMILGPTAPLPEWMPRPSNSVVITAAHSTRGPLQHQFAKLDFATRMSAPGVERFYIERLRDEGFAVVESDAAEPDARLLRFMGVERLIHFAHQEKGWKLTVTIHTESGLILPSRVVAVASWSAQIKPSIGPSPQ